MISGRIDRVLNHNAVLVFEEKTNAECVIMGKGIGFKRQSGMKIVVSDEDIQRVFMAHDSESIEFAKEMASLINIQLLGYLREFISKESDKIGPIEDKGILFLTDHLNLAIERIRSGIIIENPFMSEVRILYEEDYAIALRACSFIGARCGVLIPETEVGFVAMHFSSARKNSSLRQTTLKTRIIRDIVKSVIQELRIKIMEDSSEYVRLVTHIYKMVNRVQQNKVLSWEIDLHLEDIAKESYQIALRVCKKLKKMYDIEIPSSEVSFLCLSIEQIRQTNKN